MSTLRRQPATIKRNPDGQIVCSCGCGRVPPPGRRTWFSNECVKKWKLVNDPSYIRQALWRRDKGVCAACGCDSEAEYRRFLAARKEASRLLRWLESKHELMLTRQLYRTGPDYFSKVRQQMWEEAYRTGRFSPAVFHRLQEQELTRLGVPNPGWTLGRRTAWDADHITPVAEGGGLCGLENYQSLCHPCHKRKTAEMARRRSNKP